MLMVGCEGPQPTESPATAPAGADWSLQTGKTVTQPQTQPKSKPKASQSPDRYTPSTEAVVNMKLEPNVLNVAAYYAPYNPWVWTNDRSRVRGIIISALYLGGPDVLGVFGDGIIQPRLYVLEPDENDVKQPKLTVEWAFDPAQALPFRAKKRTAMGWGYGMRLLWSEDLDLSGKDIRMTVSFERRDGRTVHSGKKDFKVPSVSLP